LSFVPETMRPSLSFTEKQYQERYPCLGYPTSRWHAYLDGRKQWPAIIKFLDEERAKEQDNE
jgi:hypothetical protein